MKMSKSKLAENAKRIFEERGTAAYELARKEILGEKINYNPLKDAIHHFLQELQYNVHHPALMSLAYEAVKGKNEKTTAIGAALVLLTGAAHLHDDVIDSTKIKESKLTTCGKFGEDITILLGDFLLFKGTIMLYEACEDLSKKQREEIINLVKEAFIEIATSETKETDSKRKWSAEPEERLRILEQKAAVPELAMRIGAMLGEGSVDQIETLGKYGRTFGFLLAIREEFINSFEPEELMNRVESECLPLPVLYAMRNAEAKKEITEFLGRKKLTRKDISKITGYFDSEEIGELYGKIKSLFNEGTNCLSKIQNRKVVTRLTNILRATVEDIIG